MVVPLSSLRTFLLLSSASLLISVNGIQVLDKRAGNLPTLPGGWTSLGCYTEVARTLSSPSNYDNGTINTIETCIAFCEKAGYGYAGTEFSSQCWCGNSINPTATSITTGGCQMTCGGNQTEACGGPDQLNIFWSGHTGPQTNPGPGLWSLVGCYTEGITGRTLLSGATIVGGPSALTIQLCTSACQAAGYKLAGAEYSQECWCGNSLSNGGSLAPEGVIGCNAPCRGNASEFCGGTNRLDVYTFNNTFTIPTGTNSTTSPPTSIPTSPPSAGDYKYYSCRTEGSFSRALTGNGTTSASMTVEYCSGFCTGYIYFGMEYGQECYCGNSFTAGSVVAPETQCNFQCSGNVNQLCGAGSRLSVYSRNGTIAPTATTTTSALPTNTPTGWEYKGCWIDGAHGRILANQIPDNVQNSVEVCINECAELGSTVAGVEYGSQCFCDSRIRNGGVALATNDQCNMPCTGNFAEFCGGGDRINIYAIGTPAVDPAPTPQVRDLPGSWAYRGCLEDNVKQIRTFPWQIISVDNNTANSCLSQCHKFGYNAAGLEYGLQCYCGDIANIPSVGAKLVEQSQCNVPCTGNSLYYCGAGDRLTYYEWTGNPLYTWEFPNGTDAGAYSLLIGGVCVPLMTSQLVTGKVTFLEKWGTAPPNSTGAYELDLSMINNFTQAWRPMHIKTDIFCSSGLTLPDKVGRQINIGGWSGVSTFGIRLYWPDGSDGIWGRNDWQENVNEVHLQTPRWYPSTMILANGSIVVVGGEIGSNAAPSPSLEILPPTGSGILDLDFLLITDPNNLYPFIAVLPSGILVAYYNEARILNETTFETIKVLPKIPGAVNNADAGRNYPLEGTMMLLPQYAPYTDLLSILICGGSTPGPGNALDNCVTTQPEAVEPVWQIERMPSLRVMPCIAALPDGTYLILNGAHHGVAGFGLGEDPNLNAVLYNPAKPLNKRMSIMANTSVPRLYHSEAILLADGRVMVSGSDPQDPIHLEEYRVEVFTNPYLLSGLPRPEFQLQSKDWIYGKSIEFQLIAGSTYNLKVSLLGSVVSTHGNSMGQRTIFPEVNCAENICNITVPPNSHVCPPGWFQVFILDGKTPSVGQFVRIGGDPAGIGNWPNFTDFNLPGI